MMINTTLVCKGLWNQSVIDEFANIWFASEVICIQDDSNNYCLPAFRDLINSVGNSSTVLSDALLTQYCVPCVADVAAAWVRLDHTLDAVINVTQLSLVCERRNGTWCYLNFITMIGLGDSAPNEPQITCHPCTFAFIRRFEFIDEARIALGIINSNNATVVNATADLAQVLSLKLMLSAVCPQDENGVYCFPQFAAYTSGAKGTEFGVNCATSVASTCTANCSNTLNAAKADLGCCFGTLINWVNAWCVMQAVAGTPCDGGVAFLDTVLSNCNTDVGLGCAELHELKDVVDLTILGLDYAWCNAHLLQCTAIIRNLTGYLGGVNDDDFSNVNITGSTQGSATGRRLLQTAGTTVTVTVSSETQGITKNFGINVAASGNAIPNAIMNVPGAAQTSNGAAGGVQVQVDADTVSSNPTNPGAGAVVVPSIFVALAAIFASLL